MSRQTNKFVLILSCPNKVGIVYAVSKFLFERKCNITESDQFDDPDTGLFFTRIAFTAIDSRQTVPRLSEQFVEIASAHNMSWSFYDEMAPIKTVVLVSKFDHCLVDLLYRNSIGELSIDIVAIVSNHPDCRDLARQYGQNFVHLPVTKETKEDQEAKLLELVKKTGTELLVLARYMQIFSNQLCADLPCPAINIHHSFLPSFKGAKPYHQAHQRGVKLIGATAHYVTSDLDEGPIVEQGIQRVRHSNSVNELVALGRDIERQVLARAVKLQSEHRVLMSGQKTVVFG